jgi:uncharacterized membrane protein YdjX (TVP38/TMEM64 family)
MAKKLKTLIALVLLVLILSVSFYGRSYFTLEHLQSQQAKFQFYYSAHPVLTVAVFCFSYLICAALAIPGATVLTLAAGALFGFGWGLFLVSLTSSVGATLAFLLARYLMRDFFQEKFKKPLEKINAGFEKEGAFYLFALRIIPTFPFFIVNSTMGLTCIKSITFFWVSQLGMLPATAVYVNAGTQISKIQSTRELLSPNLIVSFTLLGFLPLILKWSWNRLKKAK